MLTIGLTGGIGCGKSTVTNLFQAIRVPVIDADEISHEIVQPGQPALKEITKLFGHHLLNDDGSLDRSLMREIIFKQPDAKEALERLLHPIVFKTMHEHLSKLNSPYAILSIPLLLETQYQSEVDRVLVIDCPEATQITRVAQRDQLDKETIRAIMQTQCSRDTRLELADEILENNGSLESLNLDIQKLHAFYLEMSTGKNT